MICIIRKTNLPDTSYLNFIIDDQNVECIHVNIACLHKLKKKIDKRSRNFLMRIKRFFRKKANGSTGKSFSHIRPIKVCLDLSTHCQLKCVTCPTSNQLVKKGIGSGYLSFDNFKRFTLDHPWIRKIEISNWGEVFLNHDFIQIIKWAFHKKIIITIDNGVNLNSVSDEVLEALVKYHVKSITCSIDGASQKTYSMYRVNGNFNKVIENIAKINEFKRKYNFDKPVLTWQFVAFGHNENEIGMAKAMASEFGMKFQLKLSWDDLYTDTFSPVKNKELIKIESGLKVATRKEYEEKYRMNYIRGCCLNLWHSPNINFDGKLLGCCVNHWDDYGNVFKDGLENCLRKERYEYAKKMLMGLKPERKDIPCVKCKIYMSRKTYGTYITFDQVK